MRLASSGSRHRNSTGGVGGDDEATTSTMTAPAYDPEDEGEVALYRIDDLLEDDNDDDEDQPQMRRQQQQLQHPVQTTAVAQRRRRRVCSCSSQTDLKHMGHTYSPTASPTTSLFGSNMLGR